MIKLGKGLSKINPKLYYDIHNWLKRREVKKGVCTQCKKIKKTDWALKKNFTYKKDIKSFIELCKSCHRKYDFTEEMRKKCRLRMLGTSAPHKWVPIIGKKGKETVEFSNIALAAKTLNISRTGIINNLSGLSNFSGGYVWKYKIKVGKKVKIVE